MPLLNSFQLGADPEFVIEEGSKLKRFAGNVPTWAPWGTDHGGWVIEPHPKPALEVRSLVANIKIAMSDFAVNAPSGKWIAPPFHMGDPRNVTLGGHVHIDLPNYTDKQLEALDLFVKRLEELEIFPSALCSKRRSNGYGHFGEIRKEHGHFEYRTFPSWLFSQRVTKLCLVGAKLAASEPDTIIESLKGAIAKGSLTILEKTFEKFKTKDTDADWLLTGGLFKRLTKIKVDNDLREVWHIEPKHETPSWKEEQAKKKIVDTVINNLDETVFPHVFEVAGYHFYKTNPEDYLPTLSERDVLASRVRLYNNNLTAGTTISLPTNTFSCLGTVNTSLESCNRAIRAVAFRGREVWLLSHQIGEWGVTRCRRTFEDWCTNTANTPVLHEPNRRILWKGMLFQIN